MIICYSSSYCLGSSCVQDSASSAGYTCLCPDHLTGKHCTLHRRLGACPNGWYSSNAASSTPSSCGPCRCSTWRGFSSSCDQLTGRCHCRSDHYKAVARSDGVATCLPCNCQPIGSLDVGCDAEGRCRCLAGVVGFKCERCASRAAEIVPPPPAAHDTEDTPLSSRCRVVYDECPRSFAGDIWWPRAAFGEERRNECPPAALGVATRLCTSTSLWQPVDLSRCIGERFTNLARQLNRIEKGKLEVCNWRGVGVWVEFTHRAFKKYIV